MHGREINAAEQLITIIITPKETLKTDSVEEKKRDIRV